MTNTSIINPATRRPLGKIATSIVEAMAGIDIPHRGRTDWPIPIPSGTYTQAAQAMRTLANSGLLIDITPTDKAHRKDPIDREYTLSPLALVMLADRMQESENVRQAWAARRRQEEEARAAAKAARKAALAAAQDKAALFDILIPDLQEVIRILARLGNKSLADRLQDVLTKAEALDKVN